VRGESPGRSGRVPIVSPRRRVWATRRFTGDVAAAAGRLGTIDRLGKPGATVSAQHASQVWSGASKSVLARVPVLAAQTAGAQDRRGALLGQIDLAMVGLIGAHLQGCELCWTRMVDGYRPGDQLTTTVLRKPMGAVFRAAQTESRARRRDGDGR